MEKAKVIGPNGLAPISLQRQADIRITTEVIYDVISNSNMISLEESAHAPAAIRNKARADRLAGVQTVSARLNGRRFTQVNVNDEPRKLCDASKDIEKAMRLAKDKQAAASRTTAPNISGIDPRAKPMPPHKAAPVKDAGETKDADNDSAAGSKKAGSTGGEESATSPKRPRGVTAPADFMKQVRLLHLQKQMAPKAVPAGPPRRIVFGNLPEWADIPSVLQLVYGGAIERAWSENGEVIVQFVDQDACIKYYENHGDGINLKDGDNDVTISVAMPEEGLQDNAELWKRVQGGASRVVSLSGLPTGFKTTDNENVLGIAADPVRGGKSFERILIKQAESGVNVYVSFYDLHDGWDFLQSIKEGAYDCIAGFEVDPCALAPGFHFMDEPNLMFSGIIAVEE
ncbi:hypothetical protein N7530_003921 [Penicillium desertorum]|uniref:Uncharacterized protein n=1 Tax=Penicillium desertorum TaxID=1303715 RepID=A0A9W9WXP5_9EURO|nr:hypothetical protein N7530_003921 [Penicillium desertorum]